MYTNMEEILRAVSDGTLTPDEAEREIAALNARESAQQPEPETSSTYAEYDDDGESIGSLAAKLAQKATGFANRVLRTVTESVHFDETEPFGPIDGVPDDAVLDDDVGAINGDVGSGARIKGDVDGDIAGCVKSGAVIEGDVNGSIGGDMAGCIEGDLMGGILGQLSGTIEGDVSGSISGEVSGRLDGDLMGSCLGISGRVLGDVSGDIKGDLTGSIGGDVSANLLGDLTGTVGGDVTGDIAGSLTGSVGGDYSGTLMGNMEGRIAGDAHGCICGNVNGKIGGDVERIEGDIGPDAVISGDVCWLGGVNYGTVRGTLTQAQ